jgi:hypothetical protein
VVRILKVGHARLSDAPVAVAGFPKFTVLAATWLAHVHFHGRFLNTVVTMNPTAGDGLPKHNFNEIDLILAHYFPSPPVRELAMRKPAQDGSAV